MGHRCSAPSITFWMKSRAVSVATFASGSARSSGSDETGHVHPGAYGITGSYQFADHVLDLDRLLSKAGTGLFLPFVRGLPLLIDLLGHVVIEQTRPRVLLLPLEQFPQWASQRAPTDWAELSATILAHWPVPKSQVRGPCRNVSLSPGGYRPGTRRSRSSDRASHHRGSLRDSSWRSRPRNHHEGHDDCQSDLSTERNL